MKCEAKTDRGVVCTLERNHPGAHWNDALWMAWPEPVKRCESCGRTWRGKTADHTPGCPTRLFEILTERTRERA